MGTADTREKLFPLWQDRDELGLCQRPGEAAHNHRMVRLEGTTVTRSNLPGGHGTGLCPDGSGITPVRDTPHTL